MKSKFEIPSLGIVNFNIDVNDFSIVQLESFYSSLVLIREFELLCANMKKKGVIGGPVHLAVGQEAIPVGISNYLKSSDMVFSGHRSHAHLLSLGTRPELLFAELLGKATGLSGGFGGSMHLTDENVGFFGSVPIVAGTVPIAVGAAFAAKYNNTSNVAVVFFGDGALEEGVVQESLNVASLYNLPVLFVCENNLMASHLHLTQRQKVQDLTRLATANGIDSLRLDGNNVVEIANSANVIVEDMRKESKPFFIEALTYRQLGHVDWREDIDVGVSRSSEEVLKWKAFDPIIRLKNSLIENDIFGTQYFDSIDSRIRLVIEKAWNVAEMQSSPSADSIVKNVISY